MSRAKLLAGLTAILIGTIAGGTPALAVLNGVPDSNHASVGFMFAQTTDPNTCNAELVGGCAATLVSPTVAVTSGGCAEVFTTGGGFNITAVWISFNPNDPFDCATASRVDSLQWHLSFDGTVTPSPFDIGVAVLSDAVAVAPATLPAADSQGGYVKADPFDVVNWGGISGGNVLDYRRRFSPADLMSSDADYLKLKLTLNGGHICMGDIEGGGAFLPASQDLSALIINNGGTGCKNARFLRLDTSTARGFLGGFVTLP
jgi:hypothetical protein